MLGYLILLFTVLPAVELALLIKVGGIIGAGYTVLIVLFTGVVGAYLARLQGFLTLRRIQEELNHGIMPADALFDGFLILCSGILLLTPGFLTDIIGFIGLFPFTRYLLKRWLKRKADEMIKKGKIITFTSFRH
jgi:UPF0716 protein FxsA